MAAAKAQPLTADEQKQLKALQDKQSKADWQEKEDARVARLDALKPVADVLKTDQVNTLIAGLRDARTKVQDVDVQVRLDRVISNLTIDALAITQTIDQLAIPIPQNDPAMAVSTDPASADQTTGS